MRWDPDRPDVSAELWEGARRAATGAVTLEAEVRLGLYLASSGSMREEERRVWLRAMFDSPSLKMFLHQHIIYEDILLELESAHHEGASRPCARLTLQRRQGRWVPGPPLRGARVPIARLSVRWRRLPRATRRWARGASLVGIAALTLSHAWWAGPEGQAMLALLGWAPSTWRRPPPTIGVLLVPPNAAPGDRHDRAPVAEAVEDCLGAGADWVALDVPINRTAPGVEALGAAVTQSADYMVLGVSTAKPDLPWFDPSGLELSLLSLPMNGLSGGAALRMDYNLEQQLPALPGLYDERCLPTLGWRIADRARGEEALRGYAATGDDGELLAWAPLVVPAQALAERGGALVVRVAGAEGWQRACAPGAGAVIAYDVDPREDAPDQVLLRVSGDDRGAVAHGVERVNQGAVVPGPVAQALLAQSLVVGSPVLPWHLAVADALWERFPLGACGGDGPVVQAVPSRPWLAIGANAAWLAAVGLSAGAALGGAGGVRAVLARILGALVALIVVTGLALALFRVYLPMVSGIVMLLGVGVWRGLRTSEEPAP